MTANAAIKSSTNSVGGLGELLAAVHLSRPVRRGYRRPLFKPTHLGEKYPVVDFIVDILDPKEASEGFFFVQVKSTSNSCPTSRTLKLDVELAKFNRMVAIPVPTFLIGVDVKTERAFVIAASKAVRKAFSSITKKHDLLDEGVRVRLYKEVAQYWRKNRPQLKKSRTEFTNAR